MIEREKEGEVGRGKGKNRKKEKKIETAKSVSCPHSVKEISDKQKEYSHAYQRGQTGGGDNKADRGKSKFKTMRETSRHITQRKRHGIERDDTL